MAVFAVGFSLLPLPAFAVPIFGVVEFRSEEQVARVAARRIIATVQREKAAGYFSVRRFPRIAMSQLVAPASSEHAVTPALGAIPHPALARPAHRLFTLR